MNVKALGGCCQKSMLNYENAKEAVRMLGLNLEVEHVTDINEIMKLGVMATPGLIINDKVVSTGRVLSVKKIVDLLKSEL